MTSSGIAAVIARQPEAQPHAKSAEERIAVFSDGASWPSWKFCFYSYSFILNFWERKNRAIKKSWNFWKGSSSILQYQIFNRFQAIPMIWKFLDSERKVAQIERIVDFVIDYQYSSVLGNVLFVKPTFLERTSKEANWTSP